MGKAPFESVPSRTPFSGAAGVGFNAFSGDAPGTFWSKWFGGVYVPLSLVASGIGAFVARALEWGTTRHHTQLTGWMAVAGGIALIGFGLFAHFHYFWGAESRLYRYSRPGKLLGGAVALAGLAGVIVGLWRAAFG